MNLGSDLSINNIVKLGLADTKIDNQDDVKKVLEMSIARHDYSSAFFSTLLSFFVLKIFEFR